MFSNNPLKKARKAAIEHLQLAQKIYDYRRDILPAGDAEALRNVIGRMQALLKNNTTPVEGFQHLQAEMDPVMKRAGGHFYPRHWIADNAEMLLFAAILAIGVRTFFLQPFKIPTNSMYPTYNGMTAAVYEPADAPVLPLRAVRFLTLGAQHFSIEAPEGGELTIDPTPEVVPGRKWLVIPVKKARYTFYVDESPVTVDLPLEFDIRQVWGPLFGREEVQVKSLRSGQRVLVTGRQVQAGEQAFSFDLLTGDQLFVDRMTYHFRRPEVGEPIVFRTDNLEGIDRDNKGKYYIKRCVGGPGDTLQITPPGLLRNGEPNTGAAAFERNRQQEGNYPGYVYAGSNGAYPLPFWSGRAPLTIPDGNYVAMGDNSPNSADSRMWGFVPQSEIVGRAVLIYYPFSRRWGLAE
jgi:signal peptidase I